MNPFFTTIRNLTLGLGVAVGMSGCGLLDFLMPKDADIGFSLKAPKGFNAVATLEGPNLNKTFTDDNKGLVRTLKLAPGSLTVTTTVIPGYVSNIAVSNTDGNTSYRDRAVLNIGSGEAVSIAIDYSAVAPAGGSR